MLVAVNISVLALTNSITEIVRQMQSFKVSDYYIWILATLVLLFAILIIVKTRVYRPVFNWISKKFTALKERMSKYRKIKPIDSRILNKMIKDAGFAYDPRHDIFYSTIDAWQRDMGFCRLYDEAAAPWGMIVDCEPIYFNYKGKRWMIEFWKGQYDLTTGVEIGVYNTDKPDLDIPDFFNGTFYNSASDEDLLEMSFNLKKKGKTLFSRHGKHWWLTGFIVGEYSEPWELTMKIKIALSSKDMRNEFVKGLIEAGYSKDEIAVDGKEVSFIFDKPRTPQPISRTEMTDKLIQKKNKLMCDVYQEITEPYDNFLDKINAIGQQAPELYNLILNMGKSKKMFKSFKKIKKYLN